MSRLRSILTAILGLALTFAIESSPAADAGKVVRIGCQKSGALPL